MGKKLIVPLIGFLIALVVYLMEMTYSAYTGLAIQ